MTVDLCFGDSNARRSPRFHGGTPSPRVVLGHHSVEGSARHGHRALEESNKRVCVPSVCKRLLCRACQLPLQHPQCPRPSGHWGGSPGVGAVSSVADLPRLDSLRLYTGKRLAVDGETGQSPRGVVGGIGLLDGAALHTF